MFKHNKIIGQHNIYNYDTKKYDFKRYLETIYSTDNLNMLHLHSNDYNNYIATPNNDNIPFNDIETDLHKLFYKEIKSNDEFKKMYVSLIKDIYDQFYIDEDVIIYQSYPSIRFQFINSIAVPPHSDSDSLGNHPLGEKNYIIPITQMVNTTSLFIEPEPNYKSFVSLEGNYGDLLAFNGNTCIHKNEPNVEGHLRISFDFRLLCLNDYVKYISNGSLHTTNPRDSNSERKPIELRIGGYYQIMKKHTTVDENLNWLDIKNEIPQHIPLFETDDKNECVDYINGNNFFTEFKKTSEFEQLIRDKLNVKECIVTTSGTVAIMLALMSLDLLPSDEVIVPNYTMIATINAVKMLNLKIIICDVDEETYTMSLNNIKECITPNTKCILHVSLNNRFHDLSEISNFCSDNKIFLIEDAAQSLGLKSKSGKYIGTFGTIGCYSLSTPKIISTGQGGILVTNDTKLSEKIRKIKNFGRKESGIDDFETFGLNFKFTDIQSTLGITQFKKIDSRIQKMKNIYTTYYEFLKPLFKYNIIKMIHIPYATWHPWFVDIYCENREVRDELKSFLKKHKIGTRDAYPEISKTPMYYSEKHYPNSNMVSNTCLYLPSFLELTTNDIGYICNIINLYTLTNKTGYVYRKMSNSDFFKGYLELMSGFRNIDVSKIDEETFNETYKNACDGKNIIFVCEHNSKIIGSVTLLIEQKFIHNLSKYAHVEDLYVHPEYRNEKIGKTLIEKALEHCKKISVYKVTLNCIDSETKDFYIKQGFEQRQINMSMILV